MFLFCNRQFIFNYNFDGKYNIKIIKFSISIAFIVVFIYTTELYPVCIKSLGMGATNFVGKFGIL